MLLMLVSLLCCVLAAKACLQCDRSIRLRDDTYILGVSAFVSRFDLETIRRHAYTTYIQTSRERMGIIDATTFYRVKTEYQSEFDRFLSLTRVGSLLVETTRIMNLGREILEKHLDRFIKLCPNQCGLLRRRVLDCISCHYKTYVCPSPMHLDCNSSSILAFEGDQVVLNCFQPWHRLLLEKTEYHYSWSPYLPGYLNESDFTVLVVTDVSSVILNQVQAKDMGTYRCFLQGRSGIVFYRVSYRLTVVPKPETTHQPILLTLPSLPLVESQSFQPVKDLLVPVIVMVTALSLAACVGLAVVLRMMMSQRRAAEEKRRRRMEGKNTQEDTVYTIFTLHFDSH
ncbi:izumo sperm-egg fusion protein 1 isoform X2 [Sebastes umbrosus]|uniref:izumo sperm-egg fusion protein 1 isoform X2 n=1 Tax=Sebastes umbrosus TaxID=72105 RepID=UPI00189CF0D6|nr:izumo sperm-egg fusion protein 1 isoform X2 [Sebastes umbrosus]